MAASLVMLTISPRLSASSGGANCTNTSGAPTFTGNKQPKRGTSNVDSGPIGPSSEALLTSRFRPTQPPSRVNQVDACPAHP